MKGEEFEIPFYAKDFDNIYGGQFTMNILDINIEDITPGILDLNKSNYNVVNDNLILSWNNANGITANDGKLLFTIKATANETIKLSNILKINDEIIKTEIYQGDNFEVLNISLKFRNSNSDFALYQNRPNPFSKKTIISFDLPNDSEYKLSVFNPSGKVIKTIIDNGTKGRNRVILDKRELKTTGVLFYSLESDNNTAFRKMVILK